MASSGKARIVGTAAAIESPSSIYLTFENQIFNPESTGITERWKAHFDPAARVTLNDSRLAMRRGSRVNQ